MSRLTHEMRQERVSASMLWAAWADALGFVTELTDAQGLARRLAGRALTCPLSWKRRIGGRFGVEAELPAGCYSDDTQLRLATSRAISGNGFDIEAFAHVELPVWPAYALGGGRASKAAAANLARPGVAWYANTFDGYLGAGGNGAAMRIAPHVWAASHPAGTDSHVLEVIANAAVTHGHPRALVGAVLHALALGQSLEHGHIPTPEQWPDLLEATERAVKLIDEHPQLSALWLPAWQEAAGTSLTLAWRETVGECRDLIEPAAHTSASLRDSQSSEHRGIYETLVVALGLGDNAARGSGTTTVLASLALAAGLPDRPRDACLVAAGALGTDTDTIATMAGALIGAQGGVNPPPSPVLDETYLVGEAARLSAIAHGRATETFSYPDLLDWHPPRSQIDAVGYTDGRMALAGLGWLDPADAQPPVEGQGAAWQWTTSDFGPSFFIKRRVELRELEAGNRPVRRGLSAAPQTVAHRRTDQGSDEPSGPIIALNDLVSTRAPAQPESLPRLGHTGLDELEIDQLLGWVAQRGFPDERIGQALRRIATLGTNQQFTAFATALRANLRVDERAPRHRINLLALTPFEFEELVRELFVAMGYTAVEPAACRDDGADMLARRSDGGRYLVQAKRYQTVVSFESVQALAGAVYAAHAAKGVLVTSSWFGKRSREFADKVGTIELIDGLALSGLLRVHLALGAYVDPEPNTLA